MMTSRSRDTCAGERDERTGAAAERVSGRALTRVELTLERNVHAPARARAAVATHSEQLDLDGSLEQSLVLLVSEVVSNAVRHSAADPHQPIELLATFGERKIRVIVTDAGDGFEPRPRDPARTHDGYGLYLLEKVAAGWGVESRGDTKVWFELART
jgi:anti-sigma regulatory factor (Ser/Thr protein kinase)